MVETREDLLLEDANPMILKKLADYPEMKKQQIESLKQLLAIAKRGAERPADL